MLLRYKGGFWRGNSCTGCNISTAHWLLWKVMVIRALMIAIDNRWIKGTNNVYLLVHTWRLHPLVDQWPVKVNQFTSPPQIGHIGQIRQFISQTVLLIACLALIVCHHLAILNQQSFVSRLLLQGNLIGVLATVFLHELSVGLVIRFLWFFNNTCFIFDFRHSVSASVLAKRLQFQIQTVRDALGSSLFLNVCLQLDNLSLVNNFLRYLHGSHYQRRNCLFHVKFIVLNNWFFIPNVHLFDN